MSELSHGQQIVLNYCLSEYPEDVTFVEICDMIENDNEAVTIYEQYCDWETETLIDHMTCLSADIDKVIVESHRDPGGNEDGREDTGS